MIRTFRHKGLKQFFTDPRYSDKRGIEKAEEMNIAGLFFHKLKGDRQDEYSVRVTANWRVTWKMDGEDVIGVNLEDYH